MRRLSVQLVILVLMVVALQGCAPMRPGADTFLTRSEQSLDVAFWSVDALFRIDKATPELDKLVPGAHAVIEKMRQDAPPIFRAAMDALDAYRLNQGPAEQNRVTQALAVAVSLSQDATVWLNKINTAKGGK